MRIVAVVLALWSIVWGAGFVINFVRDTAWRRHLAPPLGGRTTTAVVLGSAGGSLLVIAVAILDPLFAADWTRYLAPLAVCTFAGVGFPAWWLLQRRLRNTGQAQ